VSGAVPILAAGSALALGGAGVAAWGMFSTRSSLFGPVIHRGSPGTGVALTFDDGPHPERTPAILDALAAQDVRAAFFVIGVHARAHPTIVARIHEGGHVLANHTLDHRHSGSIRRKRFWRRQIDEGADAIAQIIGVRPRFFRPPIGHRNWHTAAVLRERGDVCVTWTRRTYDSIRTPTTEEILQSLGAHSRSGDIVLLHDGLDPQRPRAASGIPAAAIGPLVDAWRARDLGVVRLDESIGEAPYAETTPSPN
jgi:peptidoglycan/xylan/chitin deacetylase (PgdA/CDA1 family)